MTSPVLRPLSIGEILDLSFGMYRRHFTSLAGIVLICSGLPFLLNLYIQWSGGVFVHAIFWLVTVALSVVLSAIGTAAAVFVVSESYLGRDVGTGEALQRALPFVGRVLVYTILSGLLVGLGCMLLVVPGIVLFCGLALGTPALVLEQLDSGTRALSRSWHLTRGAKWKMFGLLVTTLIIVILPNMAVSSLGAIFVASGPVQLGATPPLGMLLFVAIGALAQMFLMPLLYCVLTIAYYDMRVRKEGFDLELLSTNLQPA